MPSTTTIRARATGSANRIVEASAIAFLLVCLCACGGNGGSVTHANAPKAETDSVWITTPEIRGDILCEPVAQRRAFAMSEVVHMDQDASIFGFAVYRGVYELSHGRGQAFEDLTYSLPVPQSKVTYSPSHFAGKGTDFVLSKWELKAHRHSGQCFFCDCLCDNHLHQRAESALPLRTRCYCRRESFSGRRRYWPPGSRGEVAPERNKGRQAGGGTSRRREMIIMASTPRLL